VEIQRRLVTVRKEADALDSRNMWRHFHAAAREANPCGLDGEFTARCTFVQVGVNDSEMRPLLTLLGAQSLSRCVRQNTGRRPYRTRLLGSGR
jgi:hypothetical protein